jgi:hypothetical protein
MKKAISILSMALLLVESLPAHADFKYEDKAAVTGGALNSMVKTLGIFSKKASQAMQPQTTTRYIKGNRMRTDTADGKIQIIDLDGRRMIEINPPAKTYSIVTFDQIKAAAERMRQQMQQQMQQDPRYKNASATIKPTFQVTVEPQTQLIMGQTANEVKARVDTEIQTTPGSGTPNEQSGSPASNPSGNPNQPQQMSGTISMSFDMWVAPAVTSYQEFSAFYRKLAQEVNWTPPSNIKIDPRMAKGMSELQSNASALKGFPLVEYVSMMMGATGAANPATQESQSANPPPPPQNTPTSPSGAMAKSLGGLFGKHKKQETPPSQNPNLPPPPSNPGSLMDMTVEVISFSNATLDGSVFEVPAGYTEVQQNPDAIIGTQPSH